MGSAAVAETQELADSLRGELGADKIWVATLRPGLEGQGNIAPCEPIYACTGSRTRCRVSLCSIPAEAEVHRTDKHRSQASASVIYRLSRYLGT